MHTNRSYKLCKNGIFLVEERIDEVQLTEAVAQAIVGDMMFECKNIDVGIKGTGVGRIHLKCDRSQYQYWTAEVASLKLNCKFRVNGDGVMMPNFKQDGSHEPVLGLEWKVPHDMKLRFCATIEDGGRVATYFMLTAFDVSNMSYKLPLPNLYEDTQMCLGSGFKPTGVCGREVFGKVLTQFVNSEWNTDLLSESDSERACRLFRFKPKNEGFEQQPSLDHWTLLSTKAVPESLKDISL